MSVLNLNQLDADPRKAKAAKRKSVAAKLITAKKARASSIAELDQEVNDIYEEFKNSEASFTKAQIQAKVANLHAIAGKVATHRRSALADMARTVAHALPNSAVVAQYTDLTSISAKTASLLVTAKVSLATGDELEDHEIVTIDSNGYVAEEGLEPVEEVTSEDDLSIASQDEEETPVDPSQEETTEVQAEEDEQENSVVDAEDVETELLKAKLQAAKKATEELQDQLEDPALSEEEADNITAKILAYKKAARTAKAKLAELGEEVQEGEEEDSAEVVEATEEEVETPEETIARLAKKSKAADEGVEYPEEADPVETAEEAVTASDDEFDELEAGQEAEDGLDLSAELELPDTGFDDVIQAEILDEGDDYTEEDVEEELTVTAHARSGKASKARELKLASASRKNPRASDNVVLSSLASDILA